jgi:hypothetical protein
MKKTTHMLKTTTPLLLLMLFCLFVIRMGLLDWALQYWSILTDPLQHSIKANASYWSISKNYLKEANFLAFIAT